MTDEVMAVTPFDPLEGESVVVQTYQVNSAGKAISRNTGEWFGFSNEGANMFSLGIVGALAEYIASLADAKAKGAVPAPGKK